MKALENVRKFISDFFNERERFRRLYLSLDMGPSALKQHLRTLPANIGMCFELGLGMYLKRNWTLRYNLAIVRGLHFGDGAADSFFKTQNWFLRVVSGRGDNG